MQKRWFLLCIALMMLLLSACGAAQIGKSASDEEKAASNMGELVAPGGTIVVTELPTELPPTEPPVATTDSADVKDSAEPTVVVSGNVPTSTQEFWDDGTPIGMTEDGHPYIGNLNAPVVIEEYSDFQCPFCARFYSDTYVQLQAQEIKNGDAVLIFYDFPLSIHPQAPGAANAARCAGEQSAKAYWQMHNLLFERLGSWTNDSTNQFINYGTELGLDVARFKECVTTDKYQAAIQADLAKGTQKGVRGTPAFVINGELLSGAQPYQVFVSAIERGKAGEKIVEAPKPVDPSTIPTPQVVELSENIAGEIGQEDAPVVIVEFTDYECPFCARHATETYPTILKEMIESGRVKYILKDLPLDQLHPNARAAAVAARCAGEQDQYWAMHSKLFAGQQTWSGSADTKTVFVQYATELNLDSAGYETCLASGKYDQLIEENVQEAQKLGIGGTPFFVVQGYPVISGAQPLEVFKQVVDLAENDKLVAAIMDSQRQRLEQQQAQQAQEAEQQPTGPVDVPLEGAYAIGDENAPIVVVEYTDYQCPFCQRHYLQTFSEMKKNYIDQGVVRYVFKDFPLNSIHPQAAKASEAARCALEQDQFLAMHDALFNRQQEWSGNQNYLDLFVTIATELGMDGKAFGECLNSDKYSAAVQKDTDEGASFGVRGTPAFFINGQFVNGAQPFSVFQQIIHKALADSEEG